MDRSSDLIEQRMRAALHLPKSSSAPASTAPRGRHRFVQDGEVPVVMVNPRHPRAEEDRTVLAELERSLATEREARLAAEKALRQSEDMVRQLRTRLAHAEMAQREAVPAAPPDAAPAPAVAAVRAPRTRTRRAAEPVTEEVVEWWKPGLEGTLPQSGPLAANQQRRHTLRVSGPSAVQSRPRRLG